MPEGPEVKLMAERLNKILEGQQLRSFKLIKGPYVDNSANVYGRFRDLLVKIQQILYDENRKMVFGKVESYGKLLHAEIQMFDWNSQSQTWVPARSGFLYMTCHLGMSGNWRTDKTPHTMWEMVCSPDDSKKAKPTKGFSLYFDDIRRFGKINFVNANSIEDTLNSMGDDVLSDDFTPEGFLAAVKEHPNEKIARVIINQKVISGLGNIYRCDSLYMAKIAPLRLVRTISDVELLQLYNAIKNVVTESYMAQGTTIETYKEAPTPEGHYETKVYGLDKTSAGETVETLKLDDRTIWWVRAVQL